MARAQKKAANNSPQGHADSTLVAGIGLILCVVSIFFALSLFSYKWEDISLLKVPVNDPPSNLFGPVGAWCSFVHFMFLGVGAFLVPIFFLAAGVMMILKPTPKVWGRLCWMAGLLLSVVCVMQLDGGSWLKVCDRLNIGTDPGGILGRLVIGSFLELWFSRTGAGIVMWLVLIGCAVMVVGWQTAFAGIKRLPSLLGGLGDLAHRIRQKAGPRDEDVDEEVIARPSRPVQKPKRVPRPSPAPVPEPEAPDDPEPAQEARPKREPMPAIKPKINKRILKSAPPAAPAEDELGALSVGQNGSNRPPSYTLPPMDLLEPVVESSQIDVDTDAVAQLLVDTLADFGIEGTINDVEVGPVVTSYEVLPAPGVRVERISNLANNLALSLKATSIRVQAPIPGKGVVGIEVPNGTSQLVQIRDVVEGEVWQRSKAHLPLVLGKDVGGNDLVVDLAAMPHLLIAGATGAGKTVCMNSILAGLLMSRTPDEMRLMLVDPKIVEFSVFAELPHLVVPVITDPKKVSLGLRWAINEMESRYKLFAKVGVRNIASYNAREIVKQEELFGEELPPPKKDDSPATIPYIVVIIDELADLMLADQAGIENGIARLAQLSRAVGIHMIIATQRPTVNVITGTIKANFPGRIAFQVAQRVDSRTILDTVGADKLLGKGDMLYLSPGSSKLMRAQGSLTTDSEIRNIADFWRAQGQPAYELAIKEKLEKPESASKLDDDSGDDDDLLEQAIEIIRETHRASTSSLQRRLRIGYTRAARIIDILEERGILGPPRGSEPREILIDLNVDTPGMNEDEEIEEVEEDAYLEEEDVPEES